MSIKSNAVCVCLLMFWSCTAQAATATVDEEKCTVKCGEKTTSCSYGGNNASTLNDYCCKLAECECKSSGGSPVRTSQSTATSTGNNSSF